VLERIRAEAALIRRESNALKILLNLQEDESRDLRNRLTEAGRDLIEAENSLREASLLLGQSEAALIPLQEELGRLKNELAVLRKDAAESNRRLTRSTRRERFWKIAAISVTAAFAAVEIGRVLRK
jgi:chromosome segregation ATPase